MPPLETYADRLWDYWERNLDPDLFKDRSLSAAVRGKVVLITGASSGIGKATAVKVADAGGDGAARRPLDREARGDQGARSRPPAAIAHIHRCDMSDIEDIERMADEVLAYHGHVDILVNNAGRSIRRSVALSYDRFHDYERTMQLNYFGAVRLILALLPVDAGAASRATSSTSARSARRPTRRASRPTSPRRRRSTPSAAVIASEVIDDGVHITTIHMPLVRTPMIAPTRMYDMFPAITPEEAAEMIAEAIDRPAEEGGDPARHLRRAALRGRAEVERHDPQHRLQALPRVPGGEGQGRRGAGQGADDRGVAFAHLMKGVHW